MHDVRQAGQVQQAVHGHRQLLLMEPLKKRLEERTHPNSFLSEISRSQPAMKKERTFTGSQIDDQYVLSCPAVEAKNES